MRIVWVLFLGLSFASCGVKKVPDAYYNHPLFDDAPFPNASPSATPTVGSNS